MIYEITDDSGRVVNRINADYEFVNAHFPGRFREVGSQPSAKEYDDALIDLFDRAAQTKQYDNRITCAMRASYTGPYQVEGAAFGKWMDDCYAKAYALQAAAARGEVAYPTAAELTASMPVMEWPA
jgi:hypothetical protein